MNIVPDILSGPPLDGPIAMTIGSFDGVHLGHRALLDAVSAEATRINAKTALLTLDPHPQTFFRPDNPPQLLTTREEKERLLAATGLDHLVYLPFNLETSALTREQFLQQILMDRCAMRSLVVGHDFRFGKDAAGDFEYLKGVSNELGFSVSQFPAHLIDGARVSSTLVRELLDAGRVDEIPKFLGRAYSVAGPVVSGRGDGQTLGFPTANIQVDGTALPSNGVYAASAHIDDSEESYPAAVNLGFAPTLGDHERALEAHLLDFEGDLHHKQMRILFRKRLRGEEKFNGRDELIAAISRDVENVRQYFLDQRNKLEDSGFTYS